MNTPVQLPPVLMTTEDKLWIVLSHLSIFIGVPILLPLIAYLVKKDQSPLVGYHAKEALNFHLSLLLYCLVCVPLIFVVIGIFLLMFLGIASAILAIVAAIQGADGREYRYPLTIRFIK